MDIQERLQAVQALHQELVQVIDAGERQIEEVEREREASIRRYQEARATAELRKSFLEGQMTLLSEMMQTEALQQTQGHPASLIHTDAENDMTIPSWNHASTTGVWNAQRHQEATENDQQSLAALNGTQEKTQPN